MARLGISGGLSPRGRGSRSGILPEARPGRVYPRVGGANRDERASLHIGNLSPHGRGKLVVCKSSGKGVYPRVGGGLHPKTRDAVPLDVLGSIPAWAGQTNARIVGWGTSPRGSIPAWAGEPNASSWERVSRDDWGLSPRGRGSLASVDGPSCWMYRIRSIPAWAGEPRSNCLVHINAWTWSIPAWAGQTGPSWAVHHGHESGLSPRGRGSLTDAGTGSRLERGLSPRGRGKPPDVVRLDGVACRSIPAWAGEPTRWWRRLSDGIWIRSIPAWAGQTRAVPAAFSGVIRTGLSPRGRGSLWAVLSPRVRSQVYPRVGGGASFSPHVRPHQRGLSPRGRGSRRGRDPSRGLQGSIPAWAGQTAFCSKLLPSSSVRSIPAWAGEPSRPIRAIL